MLGAVALATVTLVPLRAESDAGQVPDATPPVCSMEKPACGEPQSDCSVTRRKRNRSAFPKARAWINVTESRCDGQKPEDACGTRKMCQ